MTKHFLHKGWQITVLTRRPRSDAEDVSDVVWDGRSLSPWTEQLEGARAVINLAGRSVNCRYTSPNRQEILASRIDSPRVLDQALSRCRAPPEVWLNCSGAG